MNSAPSLDLPPLGCIVMASGLGKRFGGNKLLAELEGKPLLRWVLEATDGLFARRVVVTRHPEVEALCRRHGAETLLHDLPQRGDAVRLGLEFLGPNMEGYAFFAGDQPLIRRETVKTLIASVLQEPEHIWRLAWAAEPGLPVVFPRWTYEELLALPEGQGGRAVIRRHPERVQFLPAQDFELWDVDTPQDLSAIAAHMQGGPPAPST